MWGTANPVVEDWLREQAQVIGGLLKERNLPEIGVFEDIDDSVEKAGV